MHAGVLVIDKNSLTFAEELQSYAEESIIFDGEHYLRQNIFPKSSQGSERCVAKAFTCKAFCAEEWGDSYI